MFTSPATVVVGAPTTDGRAHSPEICPRLRGVVRVLPGPDRLVRRHRRVHGRSEPPRALRAPETVRGVVHPSSGSL
jgi:hypothetical protein